MTMYWMILAGYGLSITLAGLVLACCVWVDRRDHDDQP